MKTVLLSLLSIFFVTVVSATDDKYVEAMQKNIAAVYAAQDIAQLQTAVNTFERIGAAEKSKWEPYYYAAFGCIMMSAKEKEALKKDGYLDRADEYLKKAEEIITNESEIIALEGFAQMLRISVDPAVRGQQYSMLATQSFDKALVLNPENPRALTLMSQMQYGTAMFFKSPTTEACATAAKALEKFTSYKSSNPLAPQWGKEMTQSMVDQCSKK